jgi:hypothetical protein
MKVKLINVAEYEIKEGKTTEIPFESFVKLCGGVGVGKDDKQLPKLRLFKTMSEFMSLTPEEMLEIDQEKPIELLSNGQFLVFLKGLEDMQKSNAKSKSDATADTEEDKGE